MSSSFDDLRQAVRTVVGITVTPFTESGEVDEAAYLRLVSRAVRGGLSVLTPNGNTSEFYSLRAPERRRGVELTLAAAPDAVIIAGVGLDAETAVEEAKTFRAMGAHCIMVHEPANPFFSPQGWVNYHRQISEAVPEMGLIPYVRSPTVDAHALAALFAACPNLVAVKYAVPDPVTFTSLVNTFEDQQAAWLCGLAETWAPFFAVGGATGFTSGLVSVDPERSLRILDSLRRRDFEAAMHEWKAVRVFEALRARRSSEFNVSVVKEALAQLGLCRREVRPPLDVLPDADREAVARILAEWGCT